MRHESYEERMARLKRGHERFEFGCMVFVYLVFFALIGWMFKS